MLKILRDQYAKGYASEFDVAAQESQLARVAATLPRCLDTWLNNGICWLCWRVASPTKIWPKSPNFAWSDFYLIKWVPLTERVKLRFDVQFFNVFNHPNFALPSMVLAGIPGDRSTQSGFGAITSTTSPPTGLLGVGWHPDLKGLK